MIIDDGLALLAPLMGICKAQAKNEPLNGLFLQ